VAAAELKAVVVDLHASGAEHRLSEHVWGCWAEAACVCFARFHPKPPPPTTCHVKRGGEQDRPLAISWRPPDETVGASHANDLDATRDGAYAVAAVAIHTIDGWRVRARAQSATGADLLALRDGDDPDDFVKVEVSGISSGSEERGPREMRRRLEKKIEQVREGDLDCPGIAVVVGFELGHVLVSDMQRPEVKQ
jgi:hypothetical protein